MPNLYPDILKLMKTQKEAYRRLLDLKGNWATPGELGFSKTILDVLVKEGFARKDDNNSRGTIYKGILGITSDI